MNYSTALLLKSLWHSRMTSGKPMIRRNSQWLSAAPSPGFSIPSRPNWSNTMQEKQVNPRSQPSPPPASNAGDANGVLDRIVEQQGKVIVHDDETGAMAMWDEAAVAVRCNFNDDTPAGRQLGSKLRMKADQKLQDVVGAELKVVYFLAHAAQVTSFVDGEIVEKIRLAMLLTDGAVVDTMSSPFVKGFAYVALRAGPGPWDPPILFETRKVPLSGGRSYFVCCEKLLMQPDGQDGKAKGKKA